MSQIRATVTCFQMECLWHQYEHSFPWRWKCWWLDMKWIHGCMQLLQDASYHLVLVFVGAKRTEYIPFTLLVCHSLWSSIRTRSRNRVSSILPFPKWVLWKCIHESREETCILNHENTKWNKHQVQITMRLILVEEITLCTLSKLINITRIAFKCMK